MIFLVPGEEEKKTDGRLVKHPVRLSLLPSRPLLRHERLVKAPADNFCSLVFQTQVKIRGGKDTPRASDQSFHTGLRFHTRIQPKRGEKGRSGTPLHTSASRGSPLLSGLPSTSGPAVQPPEQIQKNLLRP